MRKLMEEFLMTLFSKMSISDILFSTGTLITLIVTIIQQVSKKFKPWTWLARQFGKAANAEIYSKVEDVEKKVKSLEEVNKKQDEKYDEEKAKSVRRGILQFADEIRTGTPHSKELFDSILEDITFYNHYCENNPHFKNEKAKASIEIIENNYKKRIEKNDFL